MRGEKEEQGKMKIYGIHQAVIEKPEAEQGVAVRTVTKGEKLKLCQEQTAVLQLRGL